MLCNRRNRRGVVPNDAGPSCHDSVKILPFSVRTPGLPHACRRHRRGLGVLGRLARLHLARPKPPLTCILTSTPYPSTVAILLLPLCSSQSAYFFLSSPCSGIWQTAGLALDTWHSRHFVQHGGYQGPVLFRSPPSTPGYDLGKYKRTVFLCM